jgi:tRNA 5-methylaminomethyl-2-thiouridine biosynthesis bifunctional protein
MTPNADGFQAMGSTYIKNDIQTEYREQEADMNLKMHKQALANASWVNDISINTGDEPGRAAIRCSLPDHLPVVGAMPLIERQKQELSELYKAKNDDYYPIPSVKPNVFLLTGLGSRGLTTAPLMAEILVSQLCGEPLPLENKLLNALNPNRFLIRDLIRRR